MLFSEPFDNDRSWKHYQWWRANSVFDGAIYSPTTPLGCAGSSGSNGFTLLVADTLSFLGSSSVQNNESCLGEPLIKDAVLVQ